MNYRTLCVGSTVVTLLFGLGFVIAPAAVLSLYGITTVDAPLALLTRYFGLTLIIYAAAIWSFREVTTVQIQSSAARLLAASQTIGLLVSLQSVLAGTVNALGWSSVLIYGFFVVAWAGLGMARD